MPTATLVPGDAEETQILTRARAGDHAAVGALYALHRDAALRLATALAGPANAEDLVADAFERVMGRLDSGFGPTTNFRAYLATTIRNRFRDLRRSDQELPLSDQEWMFEGSEEEHHADDEPDQRAELALASLPEAWQQVLQLLEVEGRSVTDTACRLGLTPAAVSSLAYRAREGLRTAYLDQTLALAPRPATTSECLWVRRRLSRYVRAALGDAAASRTAHHLRGCDACECLVAELARVNRRFRFGRPELGSCDGPGVRSVGRPGAAGGTTSPARAMPRR